ncbi:DUF2153 family protein [Candidatus Bathyarchaeota archaeon]|nr:DUF2153 family protein [Candidatus Bathyarchaeota archaeon]MCD6593645.1 DUF2153 family protein [Candidatus Bathyarchaeota archaeon]
MSQGWIETCQRILEQIQRMSQKKEKDRLDLIQSMRFSLYALHRSILGWLNWVNNPDIMVTFSQDELEEMNKKLTEFITEFIKYDIEVTKKGASKSMDVQRARREVEERERRTPEGIFYI